MPIDPGSWKAFAAALTKLVEAILRPITVISNATADRLEPLLKRKPRLYVNFKPLTRIWCVATAGDQRWMQLSFGADFSHDDHNQTVILIDGYPEGTRPMHPFRDYISVRAGELVTPHFQISFLVAPVVGAEGENWTGRIIFVDQLHRKYRTKPTEFMWAGPQKQKSGT